MRRHHIYETNLSAKQCSQTSTLMEVGAVRCIASAHVTMGMGWDGNDGVDSRDIRNGDGDGNDGVGSRGIDA